MENRSMIDPARLRELREQGKTTERSWGGFIDPAAANKSKEILRPRGEPWAQVVLGRTFDRRSVAFPDLPWLNDGEIATLILADQAEDEAAFVALTTELAMSDEEDGPH